MSATRLPSCSIRVPLPPISSGTGRVSGLHECTAVGVDVVVRAVDIDGFACQKRPDHLRRLDQPVNASSGRIERDPHGVVLRFHVSRADPDLESAARHVRESYCLPSDFDRI